MRYVKGVAKYYIWAFGIMLAHLAVITNVIALHGEALRLIILLYVFDAAWLILLCSDIYQKFWKRQ